MLNSNGFDFILTSRDGNCGYDAVRQQIDAPIDNKTLRQICSDECKQSYDKDKAEAFGFTEHIKNMHQPSRDISVPELQTLPQVFKKTIVVVDRSGKVKCCFDPSGKAVERFNHLRDIQQPAEMIFLVHDKGHYMGARPVVDQ